jgi:Holliday junction resolvase-like predicted endonuclease
MKKLLPIGISDFKKLREGGYVYVDKTKYIYRLIKEGSGYYFLSRPRRFGKSLLLSTIRYLFEGKKELYKGLYIEENWNWNEIYPVIRIDFSEAQVKNADELEKELKATIIETGRKYGYEYNKEYTINRNLRLLIEGIYEINKKQVAILIDEYDKPILDNIEKKEEVEKIREVLKGFYTTLKGLDEYIKFVIVTGISKFSKVSLFSGLNQLKDISLDERYGNICGYTQEELEIYFKEYLEGVNIEEVRDWYNGYNFLRDKVYNPFDILLYLDSKIFDSYWYKTGTPSFLIKLIKEKEYDVSELENKIVKRNILERFDLEEIRIEALMFQTGYLTIKEVYNKEYGQEYKLGYPNKEVRISFNEDILPLVLSKDIRENIADKIIEILKEEKLEELREQIELLMSNISYVHYKGESSYVIAIFSLLYSTGLNVITEDNTHKGRIDLVVIVNKRIVYIVEVKVIEREEEKGKAIRQIQEREYYKKYMNYDKIYIVGIELNKVKKRIENYEYKKVK